MANNSSNPVESNPNKDVGMIKYLGRLIGSVAGLAAFGLGVWTCVTIKPAYILAGVWQMLLAFFVLLVEAPCICMCIDCVSAVSSYFDRKPFWHRALIYVLFSFMPIVLAPQLSTILGSGVIFVSGVFYGLMSLGKKGDKNQMQLATSSSSMKDALIPNEKNPSGSIP
ncbi:CACFD1 (predicted) [Pycnogonum litorale]